MITKKNRLMAKRLKYPSHWISRKRENLTDAQKSKISVLTCYDATSAVLVERGGVDAILVGDSLGMVVQGRSSTVPVTLEQMIYHGQMVRRGAPDTFLIVDMPFGSYHASVTDGVRCGTELFQKTEAQAVKLEGADKDSLAIIEKLVGAGAPVMGHIGFTPQSYLSLGGFRVQGRSDEAADNLISQAKKLQQAGCFAVVLELLPAELAKRITESVDIVTIGIGAGIHCDGQVQVFHDLLGLLPDFSPKHAKKYDETAGRWIAAIQSYHDDVKNGRFPGTENSN